MSDERNVADKKCRLLSLPPEIRSWIWTHVLVDQDEIDVFPYGHDLPPLLATCKQIRNECVPLYFLENDFVLIIGNYCGAWTQKFARMVITSFENAGRSIQSNDAGFKDDNKTVSTGVWLDGPPNWENLLAWMKVCHEGGGRWWDDNQVLCGTGGEQDAMAAGGAFGILRELRDKPWDAVVPVLEQFRRALIYVDPAWTI